MIQREEWFAKELSRHQRGFEAGNLPSAIEAMALCASNSLPWPDWLARAAIRFTEEAFFRSERAGAERFDLDREQMRRYHAAVMKIEQVRREKARQRRMRAKSKQARISNSEQTAEPLLDDLFPLTRLGAFEAAAHMLRPFDSTVTTDAVRGAFNKILRAMKLGEAERYLAAAKSFPIGENRSRKRRR